MLSPIGIVHTVVSLLAIPFAIASLAKHGRIEPNSTLGRGYVVTDLIGVLTAFAVIKTPPGIGLTVMSLLALVGALVIPRLGFLGARRPLLQNVAFNVSFLFVLLPGFTETLTRLPVDAPFAASPTAPLVVAVQGLLFVGLVVGSVLQARIVKPVQNRTPVSM